MDKEKIKTIVEKRFQELGASKLALYPSGICWTFNGEFFRVDFVSDFWVLEWTDHESCASNNCFEDVAPMPYDITEQEIVRHVDETLLNL